MSPALQINGRSVGPGHPVYIIAELSANHGQDFDLAARTIRAMKQSGADAVKVQTYTADTLTLKSDKPWFRIGGGTLWDGKTLHALYEEAFMPWDWQPKLQSIAREEGLDFFSSPFDATAVDFLESMDVPCHKIASFELVDIPLLRKVASTGKPVIASTGMASREEIEEALQTLRGAGCEQIALLKCTSAYPAKPEEMNLRTIPDMADRYKTPVGLSDHTMGHVVPVASVALGACIVEKHFILSRSQGGPDSTFSMEPGEFRQMVDAIRMTEQSLGAISYSADRDEARSRQFRRSLFVSHPVKKGEPFTIRNTRSARPSNGLHTRHWQRVLGARASEDLDLGDPLTESRIDCSHKTVAIIQARMGSSRLPGKVLRILAGKTVLEHVVRRVQAAREVDQVVVATTESRADLAIVRECERLGVSWYRGSETDVLSRYMGAALAAEASIVVRVTSDCPLFDPCVLDEMLKQFHALVKAGGAPDYLSNVHPRTFPRGLDAEVFTRQALERADREAAQVNEREHVTPYFYQVPGRFRTIGFTRQEDLSEHRWTLDTPEDWQLLENIFSDTRVQTRLTTQDVLDLLRRNPSWLALNADVVQRTP